jgi:hypothetical protein
MSIPVLPKHLISMETLDRSIRLLQEKERLRQTLTVNGFGSRVAHPEEAHLLLSTVISATREIFPAEILPDTTPEIFQTRRLGRLPRQTARLYLLLLPVCLVLLLLSWVESGQGTVAHWLARGASLSLLAIPILIHRRSRINIEHQCSYVRDGRGRGGIVIDQLPAIQFQSYLAHEYAHHIYFERFGERGEDWIREGWARLVQWQVMQRRYQLEDNPAYLYHVLIQIISEVKFACQIISKTLGRPLPRQVKRIPSLYHPNPLRWLLTGMPGYDVVRLVDHAVGTASYFLEAEKRGPEEALRSWTSGLGQADRAEVHAEPGKAASRQK